MTGFSLRRAMRSDAPALAELGNIAGEGLPLYLWARMARPGETAWEVGRQRAASDEGAFSYRNGFVVTRDGTVIGALIGYPLPESPRPIDPATPALFVPLLELENLASSSLYINMLAVYPHHRGQGVGTKLLRAAEDAAKAAGLSQLALIVSDANLGARQLYEHHGYREMARRDMIKNGWENDGTAWVLMIKERADSPPSA